MREIEFRAWNKKKEIMVYDNEDNTYGYWDGCCNSNLGMVNTILNSEYYKEYIFMQYTGLKDKNGVKIFEGDIVKIKSNPLEMVGYIVYDKLDLAFELRDDENEIQECLWYQEEELEVIGNIYDNPKLLKGE